MLPRSPKLPPGVRRLFRLPTSRASLLGDVDEELASHLAMRVDELRALGLSESEARAEAARRFGDAAGFRDDERRRVGARVRRIRATEWLQGWAQDLGFAGRQVRRAPALALLAVLTLALGIGANTAIFSVVHRLLLAPLPYPNGDRILMPMSAGDETFLYSIDTEVAEAWRARGHTVRAMAGASEYLFSLRPDNSVDTLATAAITANFLPMLGVRPQLGRGFGASDERSDGTAAVAMISDALWRRTYGGRSDVLGRTVEFEGRPMTIVGVTPPGLALPMSRNPAPDLWMPATLADAAGGGSGGSAGTARPTVFVTLRDGVSPEAATSELRAIARTMPQGDRGTFGPPRLPRVMRARDFLGDRETRAVQVLFAAVGALLLIACANVANLLLAQAWTRQREFAVRAALGAGRWRLARQVLTESVALALAGGALGVGLAWLGLRLIVALRPPALDSLADVRIEPAVLLWTLGVSLATGILFGCAPAIVAGARQVGDVLRSEGRGGSAGIASRRVRSVLVVLEIALSLVMLVGSGLLVRSFVALRHMPLGFEPRGLVAFDVLLGGRADRDRRAPLRDAVLARLESLPGVTGAAIGTMPVKGYGSFGGLDAEIDREGHIARIPSFGTVFITPDYFRVARIALVEGRLPVTDVGEGRRDLSPEVVVNRELARRLWPAGRAIGARLRAPGDPAHGRPPDPWSTVVGVVDDTRMPDVRGDMAEVQVYSMIPPRIGDVPYVVRSAGSADDALPVVKHAVNAIDSHLYVRAILSGDTYLRDGLAPTRFATALLTAFAGIALVIAAVGLYGVIAYGVRQRTREIGVRVALGAEPRVIVAGVVGGAMRLVAVGLVLGVAAAVAATRVLQALLYDVRPADPATFVAIGLLVVAITLVASYLPARRALRIDPSAALRAD